MRSNQQIILKAILSELCKISSLLGLAYFPSRWWHFVETLGGGVLAGIETFMSQGFNLAHNIARLYADFIAVTPLAGEPEANVQEELVIAVSFFIKMVDYIYELLRNDIAPWRSLSSITNCLKPFQKMLLDIASRFESTILPFMPIRLACQKLRVSIEKLARVLRSVIKEAD
ncbi:hypothetical protein TWF481_002951 [Arthrobotrys musiformis]|uniref:Uncharacterized protein n=1 Tax=Arthrobotrys musiformis TaxID=47236 RepID=A0AAV9VU73_9PEZI